MYSLWVPTRPPHIEVDQGNPQTPEWRRGRSCFWCAVGLGAFGALEAVFVLPRLQTVKIMYHQMAMPWIIDRMDGYRIGNGLSPQPSRVFHARRWLGFAPPPHSPGCRANADSQSGQGESRRRGSSAWMRARTRTRTQTRTRTRTGTRAKTKAKARNRTGTGTRGGATRWDDEGRARRGSVTG